MEYGEAELEIQEGAVKAGDEVLLFDDLIATGGTLFAAIKLLTSQGANIKEVAAIIDLPDLGGSQKQETVKYLFLAFALMMVNNARMLTNKKVA